MCLSVNNCCCCCTLDVGTKVISILCTITAAVEVIMYGTAAAIDPKLPAVRWTFYVGIAATAMAQFVCGCLLIYGAFSRASKFKWPWAAITWLKSLFLMLLSVVGIVLLNFSESDNAAETSTIISLYFIYALIFYYFSSVVNSRRQQMVIDARSDASKRLMRHRVLPNYYVA